MRFLFLILIGLYTSSILFEELRFRFTNKKDASKPVNKMFFFIWLNSFLFSKHRSFFSFLIVIDCITYNNN